MFYSISRDFAMCACLSPLLWFWYARICSTVLMRRGCRHSSGHQDLKQYFTLTITFPFSSKLCWCLILSFHLANINVSPLQCICCQTVILHLMKTGSFECPSATDYSGNCMLLDAWFTTVHWKHHVANHFLTKHQTLAIQFLTKKLDLSDVHPLITTERFVNFKETFSLYTPETFQQSVQYSDFTLSGFGFHTVCFLVKSFAMNYLQLPVICR